MKKRTGTLKQKIVFWSKNGILKQKWYFEAKMVFWSKRWYFGSKRWYFEAKDGILEASARYQKYFVIFRKTMKASKRKNFSCAPELRVSEYSIKENVHFYRHFWSTLSLQSSDKKKYA